MNSSYNSPNILVVEDDREQMELLIEFARTEINKITDNQSTTDQQREIIKDIQIIKVSNINSLKKAVSIHKNTLLALLDCNIPDTSDGAAHDQLVKTNYRITGQHNSVDIVKEYLPGTPITMLSSFNRFQKIVSQYYDNNHNLSVNFIKKSDQSMIKRNIGHYLRKYLREIG